VRVRRRQLLQLLLRGLRHRHRRPAHARRRHAAWEARRRRRRRRRCRRLHLTLRQLHDTTPQPELVSGRVAKRFSTTFAVERRLTFTIS
jgi:hypothetical protein